METKSSSWGMLFLFIGIFSLFFIGLVQGTQLKTNKPILTPTEPQLVATDVTGFTFVGGTISNYNSDNGVLEIPACYSYGPTSTKTGTITFYNRNEAFNFLQENYAVGAEGYYEFYNEIYNQNYPWTYNYEINQYSYVAGTDIIVNTISDSAFQGNTKIEKVVIPYTIERIENFAFQNCSNLKEIEFSEGLKVIGDSTFWGCAIEHIVILDSVEAIYPYTFFGCKNLETVVIGTGVKSMYLGTFNGCTNLKTVTILSEYEITARETDYYQTFSRCPNLETIYVKESMLEYYQTSSPWSRYRDLYKIIQ